MTTSSYSTCPCKCAAQSACARCGKGYCSRDCQTKDWPTHKTACAQRQQLITHLNQKFDQYSEAVYSMVGESRGDAPPWTMHPIMEIGMTMNDFYTSGISDGSAELVIAHLHPVFDIDWTDFCTANFGCILARGDRKLTVVFKESDESGMRSNILVDVPRRKKTKSALKRYHGMEARTIAF